MGTQRRWKRKRETQKESDEPVLNGIWVDSGFIIGGSGGFEYGCPMTVGAVPLFFEMGLKNELMLQGHFRSDTQKQVFTPDAEFRWTTTVHGGLGVGRS